MSEHTFPDELHLSMDEEELVGNYLQYLLIQCRKLEFSVEDFERVVVSSEIKDLKN